MNDARPSVLLVCVHNAGRSHMAAGYRTADTRAVSGRGSTASTGTSLSHHASAEPVAPVTVS